MPITKRDCRYWSTIATGRSLELIFVPVLAEILLGPAHFVVQEDWLRQQGIGLRVCCAGTDTKPMGSASAPDE